MLRCTFENGHEASLRHVVVDGLLLKKNQVLLVKRSRKISEGGKWALVGGYVERDETIQEAFAREAKEESGYDIHDIQLLTIRDNPDRPCENRQNISFVFFCQAAEKISETDWEVDETQWFELDQLPPPDKIAFDHLEDIEMYKQYLKKNVHLPAI